MNAARLLPDVRFGMGHGRFGGRTWSVPDSVVRRWGTTILDGLWWLCEVTYPTRREEALVEELLLSFYAKKELCLLGVQFGCTFYMCVDLPNLDMIGEILN